MIIDKTKPIYIQLADDIMDAILDKKIVEDDRILSVRDLAAKYEININTGMKAIELLNRNNIIYNKRGMGYFVSKGAFEKIKKVRKYDFFNSVIPNIKKQMQQLNITTQQLIEHLNKK